VRGLILLLLFANAAHADATIGPAAVDRGIVLRSPRAAALLGDDFDPRRVGDSVEGWVVEVYRRDLYETGWSGYIGWQRLDCCMEPDPVQAPRWKDGVLHIRSDDGGFYACPAYREVTAVPRRDGSFDVDICGKHIRMVPSESYWKRRQRWDQAMAAALMRDGALAKTLNCQTVALNCDMNRLAAACPLPLGRALVFVPGRTPFILPPRDGIFAGFSQLEGVMAELDPPPVWCVTTR
jgi:hypothetical protein